MARSVTIEVHGPDAVSQAGQSCSARGGGWSRSTSHFLGISIHQQPWELFPVAGSKEYSGGWEGVCGRGEQQGGRCTACSSKAWNSWLNMSGCVKRGARRIISRNMEKAHLEQYKEGTKIFQKLLVKS